MYNTHFLYKRITLSRSSDKVKLKCVGKSLTKASFLINVTPELAMEGIKKNLSYVTPIVVGFKNKGGNVTVRQAYIDQARPTVKQDGPRGNVTATLVTYKKGRNVTSETARNNLSYVTPMVVDRKKGRKVTARQSPRYTELSRPTVHVHNQLINKAARTKRVKIFDIVYNCRVIMLISTRADYAVIVLIIFNKNTNTTKVPRSSRSRRSLTKRCKDSKGILKVYAKIKAPKLRRQKLDGNYKPNYLLVVISTRDDSAVNETMEHMIVECAPKVTRLFKLERGMTTESGEHIRTQKKLFETKKRKYNGILPKGNYAPNYGNVEISTRDGFAVNIKLLKLSRSVDGQPTIRFRCCTKGGGAYDDPNGGQRDDKNVKIIPFDEPNNRVYLAICAEITKNFHSLYANTNGTLRQIWLYRTKARVGVTHRNEIYTHIYATNLCTIFSHKLSQELRDMMESSRNVSVKYNNNTQIDRLMSRLFSPLRHELDYKNESMAPFINSITHKFLSRQQITKTKIKLHLNMSEAEVQSAVEHIPGHGESSAVMDVIKELTTSSSDKQVRLIYDPVNDTFVEAPEVVGTKNVGERRSDNVTDTGNSKFSHKPQQKNTGNQKILSIAGTEFLVNQSNKEADNAPDPIIPDGTSDTNLQMTATVTEETSPSPSPSASTSSCSTRKTPGTPSLNIQTSSDDSNTTDEFSSASDSEQQPNPNPQPQHEQIDPRIKLQKEKFWKKMGQNTDPRIAALVPIHAPKMERPSRLQALKQRASMKSKAKVREGDIVTEIMQKIDKTAEINYSVVPVGAEFVMEDEMGTNKNRVIVTATNNPNTVRPKPPRTIKKRQDKVLPFPQRRGSAYKNPGRQENDPKKGGGDNESDTGSDASWPTDQDEAIPSFRTPNTKAKTVRKANIRNKGKLGKQKEKTVKKPRQVKPKKLTKTAITNMVYKIRDPIPMQTWDENLKLEAARTRKLVKDQKIRMRQRECRARKKQEKEDKGKGPKQDVLAQVISLSNILEESEDESDKLVEFLASLEHHEEPLSPYSSQDEPMEAEIEAHIENLADQHLLEEEAEEESDSDCEWRTGVTLLRNPFARQAIAVTQEGCSSHQGYFTQQGLQRQQQQQLEDIKRRAGAESWSVPKVNLNRKEVSDYLERNSNHEQEEVQNQQDSEHEPLDEQQEGTESTMSAKNISKDRSTSRGRGGKQDRFDKGREGQSDQEEMDQDQTPKGGQEGANNTGKGNGKRQRDPPKTGTHDNTTTEDSEDELPGAKRNMTSLREKLTHVYQQKTKETREKRDEDRTTPSVAFRVDKTHAGEKVKSTTVPLLEPVKLADAPTLSLKDLVPEQDKYGLESQGQDESFRSDRIEFVVVERELEAGEATSISGSDRDYEWEIPERSSFDAIMGQAIDLYTETDWDRIDYLTFSSVGWNTGVGLFAFGSDKLEQMNIFRGIIRTLRIGNKCYESYPKRMLLNRYALTIYFNAAFQWNSELKLLFFIKKLNGFKGELTMAETRFYPEDHPTRKGCKIVACEADQLFLDELYRYPKDHAFSIRFGGNLYIRGGERIDPDDPDAVRQRRPKLTRNSVKKFIKGSGEDILNDGQREDDEAAKKARAEHLRKYVGEKELFTNYTHYLSSKEITTFYGVNWGVTVGKKLRSNNSWQYRENDHMHSKVFKMLVGYNKGGRAVTGAVQIIERNAEKNRDMRKMINRLDEINDPMRANDCMTIINMKCKSININRCINSTHPNVYNLSLCGNRKRTRMKCMFKLRWYGGEKKRKWLRIEICKGLRLRHCGIHEERWVEYMCSIGGNSVIIREIEYNALKNDCVKSKHTWRKIYYFLKLERGRSLENAREKGKHTRYNIHNYRKLKRGRSLKKPTVYMYGTFSLVMCKRCRQTPIMKGSTRKSTVRERECNVMRVRQYRVLSKNGCNGDA